MATASYRRVQSEEGSSGPQDGRTTAERIVEKLYALAWVIAAVLAAKWTNFFRVLLSDERVNRPVLHAAAVCLGINTVLLLYLTVYLPKVKKLTDPSAWDVYCPRVIPTMAFVGVVCAVLLIRATWPVWGFLAPLVLGLEAMGALFALHFVPWF